MLSSIGHRMLMGFPIQIIVMSYLLESCARSGAGFVLARARDLYGICARSGTGFVWDFQCVRLNRITVYFRIPVSNRIPNYFQNSSVWLIRIHAYFQNSSVWPNRIVDYLRISESDETGFLFIFNFQFPTKHDYYLFQNRSVQPNMIAGYSWIPAFNQTGLLVTPEFQRSTKQDSRLPRNLAVQPIRILDYSRA